MNRAVVSALTERTNRVGDKVMQVSPLPNFCLLRTLLGVALTAELVVLVLALLRSFQGMPPWIDLVHLSLFVQPLALSWAALLCAFSQHMRDWSVNRVYAAAFVLLLVLTALLSVLAGVTQLIDLKALLGTELIWLALLRAVALAAIAGALVLRYLYIQHEWQQSVEYQARARIDALQARIRPHFLFNTLNMIAELIGSDAFAAERAVEDLADLYRANLATAGQFVSLGQEIIICRQYLRIEQYRLGERLQVDWDIAHLPRDAVLPCLSFQPLLENAVYHGIEPAPDGGVIQISGRLENELISIEISNPLPEKARIKGGGHQIALENTIERIRIAFPQSGAVTTSQSEDNYRVTVRFAYRPKEAGDEP